MAALAPAMRADRAGTWFEALAEAQLEVGESGVGSVAIADRGVDLWVGLEANGRASQPPARFLQRQPRADDLRRLLARSRQHLGERHDSALRGGHAGVKTHRPRTPRRLSYPCACEFLLPTDVGPS